MKPKPKENKAYLVAPKLDDSEQYAFPANQGCFERYRLELWTSEEEKIKEEQAKGRTKRVIK